ncbi:NAD(P)-dependent oxidoreductase [uncultured Draconibacterium sp.]|uniref:NAD(P)-dependent oxidoreductase n=1 Tax=uncultured Draconibacterium sp. TaxID=1573823 RepID=UPI0029C9A8BF|nr:NAD(P)-dependent oxidoreductase [uncultured Draconibacterium sp.]
MDNRKKIKLTAYEVREDERIFFEEQAKLLNLEIIYTSETLNRKTLTLAGNSIAVTTLGQSRIDKALITCIKQMGIQCVATRTVGVNHIDVNAAKALDIHVSSVNYAPNGVADYTVMLILMSLRKYKQALFRINVNDYSLSGLRGKEMKDLTIGVVGTGSIGKQVLKNLAGFGCELIACSRHEAEDVKDIARYVSLEELYALADVISFHVPLTDKTSQMVNRNSIQSMKDGVALINCARGEIMNINDLIEGIENQRIGALAMDVFENESGIYHHDRKNDIISNREMAYIRQFPNVITTQHIAFYTDAAVQSMVNGALVNIVSAVHYGVHKIETVLSC